MRIIIILLVIFLSGCLNNELYLNELKFDFISYGGNQISYTINVEQDNIEIVQFKLSFDEISDSLSTNGYFIDTAVIYQKKIQFDKKLSIPLYEMVNLIGYDSSKILDARSFGVGCSELIISQIIKSDTITVTCSCPSRSDSLFQNEYKLLDVFFDLTIRKSGNERYDSLTKELYGIYSGNLQFNQISRSPQEYEIIGGITPNSLERDSLLYVEFFNSLPKDELVLIDLSYTSTSF